MRADLLGLLLPVPVSCRLSSTTAPSTTWPVFRPLVRRHLALDHLLLFFLPLSSFAPPQGRPAWTLSLLAAAARRPSDPAGDTAVRLGSPLFGAQGHSTMASLERTLGRRSAPATIAKASSNFQSDMQATLVALPTSVRIIDRTKLFPSNE